MNSKVKISVVSYINTLPFRHAIESSDYLNEHAIISYDIPSGCAKKLSNGTVELGLIPVAAICDLDYYDIISDYCLSSGPEVYSVLLLSEKPIEEIDSIILDFHSRSSVSMMKIIAKNHLKRNFNWIDGSKGFETQIKGNVAGLVIGDRAMKYRKQFKYVYDLAKLWIEYTGNPPVFALWVANKKLDKEFINQFNMVLKQGVDNIWKIINIYKLKYPHINLNEYFEKQIVYKLDENRKESARFLYYKVSTKKLKLN